MEIIAHRGYWLSEDEKNGQVAFKRAFQSGFGVETDVRDYKKELVISHDIPSENCMSFNHFLDIYVMSGCKSTIAINIKADGLQNKIKSSLQKYNINNYFVFDMSVPDGLDYITKEFRVFTRQSEFEKIPSYLSKAEGIWMDEFQKHWISNEEVLKNIKKGKKICLVSPELHKRKYKSEWAQYKKLLLMCGNGVMICTDHPLEARNYFNAKN